MWKINITEPNAAPRWMDIYDGVSSIGRSPECKIVLKDVSASRHHAELHADSLNDTLDLFDMGSTNGTYINRQRVSGRYTLKPNDVIRIGEAILHVSQEIGGKKSVKRAGGTHPFTRDVLLEALDEHAILLYDVARRLNTITEMPALLTEITNLMKESLLIEECQLIHKSSFERLRQIAPDTIALRAVDQKAAEVMVFAMHVPVMLEEEVLALISLGRPQSGSRPFSQRDLRLVMAVGYQVAMAIQRMELFEKVHNQGQVVPLVYHFAPPEIAEQLLQEHLKKGSLPGLHEEKVSILCCDMTDSASLAAKVGVKRFGEILNQYHKETRDIIFRHGGLVRYQGDKLIAIFLNSTGQAGQNPAEERAVLAGRSLLEKLSTINWGKELSLSWGVAIHTGMTMVGYTGDNDHIEFNALGDTVRVASHLQELARPNRLVIGPATMAAVVSLYETQRIGAITLPGRENPLQAYEVLEPRFRSFS